MLMSTITTLFCGAVSLMHMYFSDSIVTCVKFMNCGLIPRVDNVRASFMVIGALAAAMVPWIGGFDFRSPRGTRERVFVGRSNREREDGSVFLNDSTS